VRRFKEQLLQRGCPTWVGFTVVGEFHNVSERWSGAQANGKATSAASASSGASGESNMSNKNNARVAKGETEGFQRAEWLVSQGGRRPGVMERAGMRGRFKGWGKPRGPLHGSSTCILLPCHPA
jgi:hypothetical protein